MAPSDDQPVLTARSPSPSHSPPIPSSLIKSRKNNDSQQSLFYSSSTCRQDPTHRSPRFINLPILESDKPRIKIDGGLKPLKQRVAEKFSKNSGGMNNGNRTNPQKPVIESYSPQHILLKRQDNPRVKQLEVALRSETLITQELRSKISLMTQLIEKGLRETQLAEYLKTRNSSKNMSHIDIFLEIEHIRGELISTTSKLNYFMGENGKLKGTIAKLQGVLVEKEREIRQKGVLMEENQSLVGYVEECQKRYGLLSKQNHENLRVIKDLHQKTERVKEQQRIKTDSKSEQTIIHLNQQIQKLHQQNQTAQSQFQSKLQSTRQSYVSLLLQKDQQLLSLKYQLQQLQSQLKKTTHNKSKDSEYERLKWELENCMKEREYYHEEYLKKIDQAAEYHEGRLKHQAEVEFLREKLGRGSGSGRDGGRQRQRERDGARERQMMVN